MKLTTRIVLVIICAIGSVAALFAEAQVRQERLRQLDELGRRAALLAESLSEAAAPHWNASDHHPLRRLAEKFGNRGRLAGVALHRPDGLLLAATPGVEDLLVDARPHIAQAVTGGVDRVFLEDVGDRRQHVYVLPVRRLEQIVGVVTVVHDASYIDARLTDIRRNNLLRVAIQVVLISLATLLVLRFSVRASASRFADWMKNVRAGTQELPMPRDEFFAPIAREATQFAHHLAAARSAAEEEARLRQTAETLWTPERLKEHVRNRLQGRPLFAVSNREPYMHVRRGRRIESLIPAGGLVTALDPVMRSCGGTWIAHGAGDADFENLDEKNRLRVPPDDPHYTLKRVALTKEQEDGYYYGFSNEGLWPLCHIAHTRPLFRASDWKHYQEANHKFADAVLEELEEVSDPCVLVQDYHFALLPRLVKEKRPDARIALFWHIPWPNPEAFAICPWQRELVSGMLGADLVGFHTQFHCNNFLDTVDRTLESRIDWERFAVNREGRSTLVKPFPISVAFPDAFKDASPGVLPDRTALLKELGVSAEFLAVGVERMDYTKGVLERFRAVERFLEKYPHFQGRFCLVQIGAPSRTHIKEYHDFLAAVEAEAERINWRFKARDYRPIVFVKKHHSHQEILPYYKAADLCLVTSLHDGMNLVAKEFVASRDDEKGALVLSRFTGAARELRDALIINPYDIEQMADAFRYGLQMDETERSSRMRQMREVVQEHNIYRWAGDLIEELTRVRLAGAKSAL